jgi:hypothetical protein
MSRAGNAVFLIPEVTFESGLKLAVHPFRFEVTTRTGVGWKEQLPIMLAWAITIHKCQGSNKIYTIFGGFFFVLIKRYDDRPHFR